jgi:hypothetical protein
MSFLNTKVVLFVMVVLTVVAVWLLLIKKKKKPGVAVTDGAPGPVSDIRVNSAGDDDDKGPVSYYTGPVSDLKRRGLLITFKTPITSGITGDNTIKAYKIYVIDTADTTETPPTRLTGDSLFPVSSSASAAGVAGKYEWNTSKNEKDTGGRDAELFIDSNLMVSLEDLKTYKIRITAVNNKNIESTVPVFSATPIVYDKCAIGETTGCGWVAGVSTETAVARTILNPLTCITDGPKYKLLANTLPSSVNASEFDIGTWGNCPMKACSSGFFGPTCQLTFTASIATSNILGSIRLTLIQPGVSAVILTSWQTATIPNPACLLLYERSIDSFVAWKYNGTSWSILRSVGVDYIAIGEVNSSLIYFWDIYFSGTALNTVSAVSKSTPKSTDVSSNYKRLVLSSSGKLYYQLFSSAAAPTAALPNPKWQCYIDLAVVGTIPKQMSKWAAYSAII